MNVLIIDSQTPHLPTRGNETFNYRYIVRPNTDWDSFLDKELSNIFSDVVYDLIVLPFSLSDNYFDFSGIRAATHIRCTSAWKNTHTPILFWGNEDATIILKYENLGILLYSKGTYLFNGLNLKTWVNDHEKYIERLTIKDHLELLNKLPISAPQHLGGRHSIANLWSTIRWSEMMQITTADTSLKSSLFYKYERALSGDAEPFSKRWLKNKGQAIPKISQPTTKDKWKIIYIDDEYEFWHPLFDVIAPKEYVDFVYFTDFSQSDNQDDLLKKISSFIAEQDADCYLIDLRLHPSDFKDTPSKLSGHLVGENILKNNKANQIVYLTASNKVWNYLYAQTDNRQFEMAIKESPDLRYNRDQTYSNYARFVSSLNFALNESYIKTYIEELEKVGYTSLMSLIDLLLLYSRNKKLVMPSLILCEIVFLEEYITTRYVVTGNTILKNGESDTKYTITELIVCQSEKHNGYPSVTKVRFINANELHPGYEELGKGSDIYRIVSALKYVYKIPEDMINLVVKAKHVRNTKIAHSTGAIDFKIEDIKKIFEKIILQILKNDC